MTDRLVLLVRSRYFPRTYLMSRKGQRERIQHHGEEDHEEEDHKEEDDCSQGGSPPSQEGCEENHDCSQEEDHTSHDRQAQGKGSDRSQEDHRFGNASNAKPAADCDRGLLRDDQKAGHARVRRTRTDVCRRSQEERHREVHGHEAHREEGSCEAPSQGRQPLHR